MTHVPQNIQSAAEQLAKENKSHDTVLSYIFVRMASQDMTLNSLSMQLNSVSQQLLRLERKLTEDGVGEARLGVEHYYTPPGNGFSETEAEWVSRSDYDAQ